MRNAEDPASRNARKRSIWQRSPIIKEKVNQVRCNAKFTQHSSREKNVEEQHEWDIFPVSKQRCRRHRISKWRNFVDIFSVRCSTSTRLSKISDEPHEHSLRYSASTRSTKIPVTVQKLMHKMLKAQKEHPQQTQSTPGRLRMNSREQHPEETVPGEVERVRRFHQT